MTTAREIARRFLDNNNTDPLQIHNAAQMARDLWQETTTHAQSTYANTFRSIRKEAARKLMDLFEDDAENKHELKRLMVEEYRSRYGYPNHHFYSFDFPNLFREVINDYYRPGPKNMSARKTMFSCGELLQGIVGYTQGQRWNGWECPYFEKDQVNEILESLDGNIKAGWIGNKVFVKESRNEVDEYEPTEITHMGETKTVWPLGSWCWTWEEYLVPIAFMGFKGSGKSEAASYLRKKYGHKIHAFAHKVKDVCGMVFGLSHTQMYTPEKKEIVDDRWGKTPRKLMQLVGTEFGRAIDEDVWVKSLMLDVGPHGWLIEDCRFPNEAEAVREKGGIVVGIRRDKVVPEDSEDLHASESKMLHHWDDMADVTIENNDTLEELHEKVEEVFQSAQESRLE